MKSDACTCDTAERVAKAVLEAWKTHAGAATGTKVVVRNGAVEWTILAGVCIVIEGGAVVPIALGTGTKTLPYESVRDVPGDALHDSHAEVLARRGARRWVTERILLEAQVSAECESADGAAQPDGLPRLFRRDAATRRWKLKSNVKVWWYISTLPCGECSMPLLARRRAREDALLARSGFVRQNLDRPDGPLEQGTVMRGRNSSNDHDGREANPQGDPPASAPTPPTLRTVPGRADSPPSLSHSCTDKLLLWSLVGWQGAALSQCIDPLPFHAIVVSDVESAEVEPGDSCEGRAGGGTASTGSVTVRQRLQRDIERGLDIRKRWPSTPCPLSDSASPKEDESDPHLQAQQLADQTGAAVGPDWVFSQAPTPPLIHITAQTFPHSQENVRRRAIEAGLLPPVTPALAAAVAPTRPPSQLQLVPSWESTSYIRPQTLPRACTAANEGTRRSKAAQAKAIEYLVHGIKRGASARRVPPATAPATGTATGTCPQRTGPTPARRGVLASGARARSRLCKMEHLALLQRVLPILGDAAEAATLQASTTADGASYAELKGKGLELASSVPPGTLLYRQRKALLRGRVDAEAPVSAANAEEAAVRQWLEKLGRRGDASTREAAEVEQTDVRPAVAPLAGWLVTPRTGEAFDVEGNWTT